MSVLEYWDQDGIPASLFTNPGLIRGDVQALISAIVEHSYETIDRGAI